MTVKIIGEGNQEYPVLAIDRWRNFTLGMPDGGVRTVHEGRLIQVPEGVDSPKAP
jgi:hypothetical protein